jgi:hypothetical protein
MRLYVLYEPYRGEPQTKTWSKVDTHELVNVLAGTDPSQIHAIIPVKNGVPVGSLFRVIEDVQGRAFDQIEDFIEEQL